MYVQVGGLGFGYIICSSLDLSVIASSFEYVVLSPLPSGEGCAFVPQATFLVRGGGISLQIPRASFSLF